MSRHLARLVASALLLGGSVACGGAAVAPPPSHVLSSGVRLDVEWRVPLEPDGGSFTDNYRWRPRELGGVAVSSTRGVAAFATRSGHLVGLDMASGERVWTVDLGDGAMSAPVEVDGVLYVAHVDGALRAIDARSGGELWSYSTGTVLTGEPGVGADHVAVVGADDTLYVVDRESGRAAWRFERTSRRDLTVEGASSPTFSADAVFAGFSDGSLACLALDGSTRWVADLAGGQRRLTDVDGRPLLRDGVVYASGFSSGLFAVDAATGQTLWSRPMQGATSPVWSAGRVVVADTAGRVHWLDPETGDETASLALEDDGTTDPARIGGHLVFGTSTRGLAVVDGRTPWLHNRFEPDSGVSAAAAASDGALFVLTNLGYAYRIDAYGATAVR